MQAQSRLKMIAKMTPITSPQEAALKKFTFPEPEELSPPIINLESASVGYDGRAVSVQAVPADRPGRPHRAFGPEWRGQVDPVEAACRASWTPWAGGSRGRAKLRIGYFAQHQLDELHADETPLGSHPPPSAHEDTPAKAPRPPCRASASGRNRPIPIAAKLSGGQKARLSLLLATIDAPHMLILDEPTNHLDMERREGLIEALAAYSGAVVLVSHDMHLLAHVADRLWLVKGGTRGALTTAISRTIAGCCWIRPCARNPKNRKRKEAQARPPGRRRTAPGRRRLPKPAWKS